jgi:hypothetical protein
MIVQARIHSVFVFGAREPQQGLFRLVLFRADNPEQVQRFEMPGIARENLPAGDCRIVEPASGIARCSFADRGGASIRPAASMLNR